MAKTLSPDEVRDHYVAAMSSPLGEAFTALYHNTAWLYSKWHSYRALFDDKDTVELLNATAGRFFRDLQLWLEEGIFLHLCRLTDPPQSAGNDNLSLRALPGLLPSTVDTSFQISLIAAIEDAVAKTGFARTWRNKLLAHTALPAAAGGKPFVIPDVKRADIVAAIDAVGAAMNCVESHYIGGEIGWDVSLSDPLSVRSLLLYLVVPEKWFVVGAVVFFKFALVRSERASAST
ncbi:MAG: hypothetical protein WD738_08135, partial [Pirellulales bacterium]